MASVALTSLSATLKLEFLQPNNLRVSVDDEASICINSLFENISSLQAFVQEKSGGGPATRDLEMKIRDFALEAEDGIEIQFSNFLLAKNAEDQQNNASEKLMQIFEKATEKAVELLKLSSSISKEAVKNESEGALIPWIKHSPVMLEGGRMVGRQRDHMLIVDKLALNDSLGFHRKIGVITILGMTRIGKTTLATSVYNDPKVASHFVRGWITMSLEYNKTQTLHDLLWTLTKEANIPDDDDVAATQVYNFLKGKRFLIVVDNLCNTQAWYDIRRCLPHEDDNGSRVVRTTHLRRAFPEEAYYRNYYVHHMSLLNSEESWDLFCNNSFLEPHMASKFKKIRSQVVEICEGLPHSILVVAKRLSKCDNIQQEWKKVEKEIELLGVLDRRALTLTYNQLPEHLKVCFLYFGVFPKRSAIEVKLIIRLWIAEGFIKPLEFKNLEDQAYGYLQELIDRSLILIDDNIRCGEKIKNCRMHSALHSFCVREAQKEGIFCALNTLQLPRGSFGMFANSCRWLSLYTHKFDYYVLLKTNNPRSIFFFQEDADIFISFKLLRVLAFAPSSFLQRVPTRLHDLVFLRYLSVSEWFEGLEYVVSNNENLQTLVVSSKESQLGTPTIHLPSTIWESPQLRHLELDKSYVIDPPNMDKDNMQTLFWVCPTHCRTGVHCRFPNIKDLKIFVSGGNPITLDNLECLKRLEMLTISVLLGHVVTLPKPFVFPSQLGKLSLNGIILSERDLMVIGMLPYLGVLKLKNVFHGKVWEVEASGFHSLQFLLLEDKTLKQWRVDKNSFRMLQRLVLRFCYCLKKIPLTHKHTICLKSIEFQQCCPSVVTSAEDLQRRTKMRSNAFEIKIVGPEYDESPCTDIEESIPSDDE